ncbi:helix-turn-helix domain-containing protein [Nocardia sp. NPDC002869]|uniref:helix-turn-helix domain-containing protein n=1 Tax=Nocardia sp. NPDC002869 TaxID=3161032 RepID=UPI00398D2545
MSEKRLLDLRGVYQVDARHVVPGPRAGAGGLGMIRWFGFDIDQPQPVGRRKIPGGTVKIVFALDGTFAGRRRDPCALVVGMHDRGGVAAHHGRMCSVQVQLAPSAARRLLGVPLSELRNSAVDLGEFFGASAPRLAGRLAETASWPERFGLVADYLRQRGAPAEDVADPVLAGAVARLRATRGRIPIAALADECGWSRRHLDRRFADGIGLPPKTYASLQRFSAALAAVTETPAPDLCRIASAAGYFDQSHLIRDFQRFAGTSPLRLRSEAMSRSSNTADPSAI